MTFFTGNLGHEYNFEMEVLIYENYKEKEEQKSLIYVISIKREIFNIFHKYSKRKLSIN